MHFRLADLLKAKHSDFAFRLIAGLKLKFETRFNAKDKETTVVSTLKGVRRLKP